MPASLRPFNLANIDASLVDVITGQAGEEALVSNLMIANILGSDTTYDVTFVNDATGVTSYIVKGATLKAGESVIPIGDGNKQALLEDDKIQVKGGAVNSLDVTGTAYIQPV